MAMREEYDRPCPNCGTVDGRPLPAFQAHHLVRCRSCGTTYAGRSPRPEELERLYASYPVHSGLSPITRKRFEALLDELERYRSTGRLIDVGSGSGYFLDVARERGWDVHGTEYDPRMVEACRARGISMEQGPLDPGNYEPGSFDVVTSFEVLEHLLEPRTELGHFRSLLRPGGRLYLTTPNFNALSRHLAGPAWNIVNYPEHLNYFTPRSLARTLRAVGFQRIAIRTTGISVSRIRSSRTRSKQENVDPGNDDQRLRHAIDGNAALRLLKRSADGMLTASLRGDTIKVSAEAPAAQ